MAKSPAALLYDHVNSRFMKYLQEGTESLLGVAAKIRNAAGTTINPAQDETLQGTVDSGNSTTAQLAADAVFTGTGVDLLHYGGLVVDIHSDQDSAENGIEFQASHDNSVWETYLTSSLVAAFDAGKSYRPPIHARYFRLKYTNGDTTTTGLSIQALLFRRALSQSEVSDGEYASDDHHGTLLGGLDDDRLVRFIRLDENRDLRVAVADNPAEPIFVTLSAGQRSYYHSNLVNIDEPARIDTGADGPYEVGGDTFTIAVDGGANQTPTFPTKTARAAVHYSAPHPRTANPDHHKLKLSIDGGALTEVEITKGYTTGADIAAALQTEIQANVPNGGSATVEYDTAEYPFRYVFKSGTTGASSSISVQKADDLAKKVLFATEQFGGTTLPGLAANYYHTFEVITYLSGNLTDVQVFREGDGFYIQTVAAGASASLQVTAGGANTDFQFTTSLTSGTAGSGDDDMAVDGATATVRYAVEPPAGRTFVVDKLRFYVRDDGIALNKFAGQAALTAGVKLEIRNEGLGLIPVFEAITSAGLMAESDEAEIIDNGWATNGQDLLKAIFNFSPGLPVAAGSITNLVVSIRDDLTGLDGVFTVRASGWVEQESE